MPVICAVDRLVGGTNGMRIEALSRKGSRVRFSVTHEDLKQCVGLATAALAVQDIHAGGYFPAELPRVARLNILDKVKRDAISVLGGSGRRAVQSSGRSYCNTFLCNIFERC